jgi:hypothetical protein
MKFVVERGAAQPDTGPSDAMGSNSTLVWATSARPGQPIRAATPVMMGINVSSEELLLQAEREAQGECAR